MQLNSVVQPFHQPFRNAHLPSRSMIGRVSRSVSAIMIALSWSLLNPWQIAAAKKTQNVFLITADGLRWQEVFRGAEDLVISKEFGNFGSSNTIRTNFWRETVEARRELLFPFLWKTVARQGQLWGNRSQRSEVRISNTQAFSYPGYNEFLTGFADPEITSNDKRLNLNTNVLEWLNVMPRYRGKVAAVISWEVLPWILNAPRAGFPIWSPFEMPPGSKHLPVPPLLSEIVERGRNIWADVVLDSFVVAAAKECIRELKPRVLYVQFGETDDWAHEGHYERYLRAAQQFDRFVGELWDQVQSMPQYRGTTTFLITVDHGRGPTPIAWRNHGKEIPEASYIWMGILGPDTPALGERKETPLISQSQIADTLAAFLGEDFHKDHPRSAKAIEEFR